MVRLCLPRLRQPLVWPSGPTMSKVCCLAVSVLSHTPIFSLTCCLGVPPLPCTDGLGPVSIRQVLIVRLILMRSTGLGGPTAWSVCGPRFRFPINSAQMSISVPDLRKAPVVVSEFRWSELMVEMIEVKKSPAFEIRVEVSSA